MRREDDKYYTKQNNLKFTFRTAQYNSSLFTAMWKTVAAVKLSWNKKKINAINCHTANGDETHSL